MTLTHIQRDRHREILAGRPDPFDQNYTYLRSVGSDRWHVGIETPSGPVPACGVDVDACDLAITDGPLAWVEDPNMRICHDQFCYDRDGNISRPADRVARILTLDNKIGDRNTNVAGLLATCHQLRAVNTAFDLNEPVDRQVARELAIAAQHRGATALRAVRERDLHIGARLWVASWQRSVVSEPPDADQFGGEELLRVLQRVVAEVWPTRPDDLEAELTAVDPLYGARMWELTRTATDTLLETEADGWSAILSVDPTVESWTSGYPHRMLPALNRSVIAVPASVAERARLMSPSTMVVGAVTVERFDALFDVWSELTTNHTAIFTEQVRLGHRDNWQAATRIA